MITMFFKRIFSSPETQTYIQRMEQEKEKSKGQDTDNRSFLAKYVSSHATYLSSRNVMVVKYVKLDPLMTSI